MGWMYCEEGFESHEGYLVGVVKRDDWGYRDLRAGVNGDGDGPQRLQTFQIACSCGWRSPRLWAPLLAEWCPSIVLLHDDAVEDHCSNYWLEEHVKKLPRAQGDAVLYGWRDLLIGTQPGRRF